MTNRGRLVSAATLVVAGYGACAPDSSIPDQELLCDPGSYVFCRCPGGQPGSKLCNGDGRGFAECLPEFGGACPPRGEGPSSSTSTTTTTSTGTGGAGGGGNGGGGTGLVGTGVLLDPCADG